jgi:hypothetical protein
VDWEDGDILMLDNLLVSHAHAGGGSGPAALYAGPCFSLPGETEQWRDGWAPV